MTTSEPQRPSPEQSVSITLTATLANTLWHTGQQSFLADQRDRFEGPGDDMPDPDDAIFDTAYMMWCATAADAVLLLAYENAVGNTATLLWDVDLEARVVLSTRDSWTV